MFLIHSFIDLGLSNFEFCCCFHTGISYRQAQLKNQNKCSKFKIWHVNFDELPRTLGMKLESIKRSPTPWTSTTIISCPDLSNVKRLKAWGVCLTRVVWLYQSWRLCDSNVVHDQQLVLHWIFPPHSYVPTLKKLRILLL